MIKLWPLQAIPFPGRWVGAFSIGFFFLSFLALDTIYQYKMCALCLAQRVAILGLGCALVFSDQRPWSQKRFLYAIAAVFATLGVGLSIWHLGLLYGAGAPACPLMIKKAALTLHGGFFSKYQWLPCERVQARFLGMELSFWALTYFLGCLGVSAALWRRAKRPKA